MQNLSYIFAESSITSANEGEAIRRTRRKDSNMERVNRL